MPVAINANTGATDASRHAPFDMTGDSLSGARPQIFRDSEVND